MQSTHHNSFSRCKKEVFSLSRGIDRGGDKECICQNWGKNTPGKIRKVSLRAESWDFSLSSKKIAPYYYEMCFDHLMRIPATFGAASLISSPTIIILLSQSDTGIQLEPAKKRWRRRKYMITCTCSSHESLAQCFHISEVSKIKASLIFQLKIQNKVQIQVTKPRR